MNENHAKQIDHCQKSNQEVNELEVPQESAQNPAKKIGLVLILLMVLIVTWYVTTDKLAPYSSQGAVNGYVTQLSAQVSGQVTEVFVEDGDSVEAGDALFQLDPRPFQLTVEQAKTDLARALQATEASAAAIVSSQAALSEAKTNLENVKLTTKRTLALASRNLLPKAEEDNAQARLLSAQASYQRAEANLNSAMLSLGQSGMNNLEVKAAQLRLENALLQQDYSVVKAPTKGVVTNLKLAIGQYVAPGSSAMTFIDGRDIWIAVDLRENQLANVEAGDEVDVLFDAVPGQIFKGKVRSIAWGIDPGRTTVQGLIQNKPSTQWFEPARKIPVYVELEGGTKQWPATVRTGGKVDTVIYTKGRNSVIAYLSSALMTVRAHLSYLY